MEINSITHSKYLGKVYDIYPYIIKEVNEKGEYIDTPYCDKCGNFANGLYQTFLALEILHIPLCKTHFFELLDSDESLQRDGQRAMIFNLEHNQNHLRLLRENE